MSGISKKIILDGESLTLKDVYSAVREGAHVELAKTSVKKVERSRKYVEDLVKKGAVVYGITTGFGEFASVGIKKDDAARLQKNLIMSHAAGCGEYYEPEFVRAAMVLRANALAKGYSGITTRTLQTLIDMINHGITPMVPIHGSVGSSGDLAPLAHIVLAMLAMGEVHYKGKIMKAAGALKQAKITKAELSYKEGLALINGTQMMCGIGALLVRRAHQLYLLANVTAALSTEALMGTPRAFNPLISMVRPHKGQMLTSKIMTALMSNSGIVKSHTECGEVQDAYSIRCVPQVHGAVYDAVKYVESVINVEMNSATDNPLIFVDEDEVISGGNFHGEPVAIAMDFLGIAVSELASISERRSDRLVNPNNSHRTLPAFLIKNGGLNSGFMIAQYTAAAVVSENKVLAHPAVVDTIPTSANKEDFNSMGSISARKCIKIISNVEYALAIELLLACQGIDFRLPVKSSKKLMSVHAAVRKQVTHMSEDRVLSEDINKIIDLIKMPEFNALIESICK
ncbi:MAG: histidine ammonia-lyase [Candidatus Wallbacteria bacterium GWC2_49_35]|uniref:Histidine ammonia-lyase n=1 Tax=Candidatus Wallbacteria bacterium GWC2_49_35 TaxID=1817813 RepID=A0A1F7WKX3_9BACT|nr:MAG: histidine ammonia-lyase [Candidatus Wallbacteria bacterium GWC2_49_35]HBC75128.1 histidine ammonia-lyase [Candidatus Wallbacteria bacterium]